MIDKFCTFLVKKIKSKVKDIDEEKEIQRSHRWISLKNTFRVYAYYNYPVSFANCISKDF